MPCPSSRASVPTAQNAGGGSARPTQSTNADGRRPPATAPTPRNAGWLRRSPRSTRSQGCVSVPTFALVVPPKTNRPAGRATPDDLSGFYTAMADYGRDVSDPDRLASTSRPACTACSPDPAQATERDTDQSRSSPPSPTPALSPSQRRHDAVPAIRRHVNALCAEPRRLRRHGSGTEGRHGGPSNPSATSTPAGNLGRDPRRPSRDVVQPREGPHHEGPGPGGPSLVGAALADRQPSPALGPTASVSASSSSSAAPRASRLHDSVPQRRRRSP